MEIISYVEFQDTKYYQSFILYKRIKTVNMISLDVMVRVESIY